MLISVNVTASFFEAPSFIDELKNILKETQADAKSIKLEITESEKRNITHIIEVGKELTDLGFEIVIDDFGTGYSSLSVLNNLYVKVLKIDKSFIDLCVQNKEKQLLLDAIITIAKSLTLKVIIEGVETHEQIDYLQKYNNIIIQGYYFSRPLKVQDLEAYILSRK